MKDATPSEVAFVTFTLDADFHRRISTSDIQRGHRLASLDLGRWLDAMNLYEKRRGNPKLEYFWCREETKRGVCHLHMLLVSAALAAECKAYDATVDWHPAPERWQQLAGGGGVFGRLDASRADTTEALAAYCAKVSAHTTYGELVKASPTPEGHALRQRSYGASRGFLAAPAESIWTGELLNSALARVDGKPRVSTPDDDYEWTLTLDLTGLPSSVAPDLD